MEWCEQSEVVTVNLNKDLKLHIMTFEIIPDHGYQNCSDNSRLVKFQLGISEVGIKSTGSPLRSYNLEVSNSTDKTQTHNFNHLGDQQSALN